MSIGPGDAVLPQVPMFHANAWGMPYAAAAVGAKQVFFAGALEPAAFVDLLHDGAGHGGGRGAHGLAGHRRRAGPAGRRPSPTSATSSAVAPSRLGP